MEIKEATFHGGIHPSYFKDYTKDKVIKKAAPPKTVVIPMQQHIGAPCEPLVKKGDEVKLGQKIGDSKGFVSAPIHASVSGKVVAVEPRFHNSGKKVLSVVIESDGLDTLHESIKSPGKLKDLSSEKIKTLIRESGIVGLGGATFPTQVKLSPPPEKKIEAVILNGAECEPYLTADHRLMVERPEEIVFGLKVILKALNVEKGYIGIEDNKPDAIEAIKKVVENDSNIVIYKLHTKYPQGAEKQLIKAITGKEVPSGGLPADVGVVVQNVGTAAAIGNTIKTGIPLIERVVTITGSGIKEPQNLLVRLGVPIKDIIEQCGGFSENPGKIIMGGPMMGVAQFTTEIPVVKGTSGILVLNKEDSKLPEPFNCIRCGKCVEVCPMNLMPLYISSYTLHEMYDKAEEFHAMDCIECGSCSYICPSRRPLVESIRLAKEEIKSQKSKA
ncbi:electron transport complex protein RnfC [Garciella nitratireducens DSM 15102]|uniref:Ion-translocating oxidoreductase complex subunit C n=1 Tax=Garciella nitratireducens DSM 15102 TaxID=1121911 RepID=A0A1T4K9Z6_9FIRM|nr:electron transport complex protein RnfC [Garciella nitratireducens DSM 15102]